ncbi:MAG: transcriptional regulator, partial [Myxococcales bacterium]|nr:transcriptional regulator [Myxococcales bacterium]
MATVEALIFALQRRGVATAWDLAAELGVSQPTLSRLVTRARASAAVVAIGKARAARYAAVDPTTSFRGGVTVHRVDAQGRITPFGRLVPLVGGSVFIGD